jgi:hypothetical protein
LTFDVCGVGPDEDDTRRGLSASTYCQRDLLAMGVKKLDAWNALQNAGHSGSIPEDN